MSYGVCFETIHAVMQYPRLEPPCQSGQPRSVSPLQDLLQQHTKTALVLLRES
jgi:hypothetical protein